MEFIGNKSIYFIVSFLFIMNCGNNNQKVYKQFDTMDISTTQSSKEDESAWNGGPGFEVYAEQLGWETNKEVESIGSPEAIKGDTITILHLWDVMPPTFRGFGKETRDQLLALLEQTTYESLLIFNPETFEWEPELATHWRVGKDSLTFFFRIDPRAKWADGRNVTSEDVVATYKILIDEGHGDPTMYTEWRGLFEEPVAETKYIVSVKSRKVDWRNMFRIASVAIYPSYYLSKIDGASYLEKYQYEMMPGTGPYELDMNLTTQENNGLLALKRRLDYWAIDHPRNVGINNFDIIKFVFINDDNQKNEQFFNGDFDIYSGFRAQWWAERFTAENYDQIKRGLIQKRKIFNYRPIGVGGKAFNTLKWPFGDIRVRKAFAHLHNVDKLIDKLFFNEYVKSYSYYPMSRYEHPDNLKPAYNPDKAFKLLKEAGWAKEFGDQWLTKDGKKFEIDMYIYAGWDRIHNYFVNDLDEVGIKLNLVVLQSPFEKFIQKTYTIHQGGWAGVFLPNPEGMFHSKYAEEIDVTNATGMANAELDKLAEEYNRNWDINVRTEILQQIDSIATREYHFAFGWQAPYGWRGMYWNRFGMPEHGLGYGDSSYKKYWGYWASHMLLWWSDPEKKARLKEAKNNPNITLPTENIILDYYNKLK
jgi:microcin C transport system substrate-binding protein